MSSKRKSKKQGRRKSKQITKESVESEPTYELIQVSRGASEHLEIRRFRTVMSGGPSDTQSEFTMVGIKNQPHTFQPAEHSFKCDSCPHWVVSKYAGFDERDHDLLQTTQIYCYNCHFIKHKVWDHVLIGPSELVQSSPSEEKDGFPPHTSESEDVRIPVEWCNNRQLAQECQCVICNRICENPINLPCHHIACQKCIPEVGKCAKCDTAWTNRSNMSANTLVGLTIDFLTVTCPQPLDTTDESAKCGMQVKASELKEHWAQHCEHIMTPCKFCGHKYKKTHLTVHEELCANTPIECPLECGRSGLRKEETQHLESVCPNVRQVCSNDGCSETLRRADLPRHISEECPQRVVSCDFNHYGCDVILPFCRMGAHLELKRGKHLSLTIQQLQSSLNDLTRRSNGWEDKTLPSHQFDSMKRSIENIGEKVRTLIEEVELTQLVRREKRPPKRKLSSESYSRPKRVRVMQASRKHGRM